MLREPEVSFIIPCYNEAKHIESTVQNVDRLLAENTWTYEIIIAEDGSTDGTDKIARKMAAKNSNIKHQHRDRRLGKGRALRDTLLKSRGNILVFMDADASTDLNIIPVMVSSIRTGYDICVGTRKNFQRNIHRRIASLMYNLLTRIITGSSITDHQCGLKAFKAETIKPIINETTENGWLWDTELLVNVQRAGLNIRQIQVNWTPSDETKMNLIIDSWNMLVGLFRIR